MSLERRRVAVRAMRTVAAIGCGFVLLACVGVAFRPVYAAVAGTLACAVVASAAFYGAYEGFDEWLRRGPDPNV